MKRILVSLLVLAMFAIPSAVVAGSSFSVGYSNHSGYHGSGSSLSLGFSAHSGYSSHRSRTVVVRGSGYHHPRSRTVIVRPSHRVYHNYRPYRPVVPRHYGHPNSYVHRQEGRVYEEEYYERRVYVVPSGGSRVIYHPY